MDDVTPHRDEKGRFSDRPDTDTLIGEESGEQAPFHHRNGDGRVFGNGGIISPFLEGSFLMGNGGSCNNPMGFPSYGESYLGTHPVYRLMLSHPSVRLVRAIATADILCNKWEYVAAGKDKSNVQMIHDMFEPIRTDLLNDFYMRGRDHGWQGGELIWERRGLLNWLLRVKPLLVDVTRCLYDEKGNYSGLLNTVADMIQGGGEPEVRLAAPYKAWKYTYDSEAGYLYGRSWLENIRTTAWKDWLDCAQQLQRLGAKITGIQLLLTHPAGTFPGPPDSTGKATQVSYSKYCNDLIKALAKGSPGGTLPSLNLPVNVNKIETARIIAELAQKSLISAQLLNHGTNTPAIEGILNRMKHAEELIFAGGMRPAGVGMRAEDGKANTGEHKDTGSKVSQLEDADFAKQCQTLVDAALVLNRGQLARGTVRIIPPSIVDNKRAYFKAILLACLNDPTLAREVLRVIDVNSELANIDIRTVDKYSADRVQAADDKAAKDKAKQQQQGNLNSNKKPEPQGGRPKKGEGNPKRRKQAA